MLCISKQGIILPRPRCCAWHRPLPGSARKTVQVYNAFLDGSIHVPGKDLCDMSGATGRTREEFTVYNVMLPRKYHPQWQGNLLERRCKARAAVSFLAALAVTHANVAFTSCMQPEARLQMHPGKHAPDQTSLGMLLSGIMSVEKGSNP